MPRRQEVRSEETRAAILAAAGQLFAEEGFDAVTMREIARVADCSHTTIYIYFKDKEALLHQLSMEPLQALRGRLESILGDREQSPQVRLKLFCRAFLEFCLLNRTMYNIFFMVRATRVDEEAPTLEINQIRNQLFAMLRRAIGACLPAGSTDEQVLAFARIYFFTVHGMIATYTGSEEGYEALIGRLGATFDLASDVMLAGFLQNLKGVEPK